VGSSNKDGVGKLAVFYMLDASISRKRQEIRAKLLLKTVYSALVVA